MRFKYSAKTRDGTTVKRGEIDAPNRDAAVKYLRDNDLIVYQLIEIKGNTMLKDIVPTGRISLDDKVTFTDQLASMIGAGLPLTKALEILTLQTKNKGMSEIIQTLLNEVESGSPLSRSLEKRGDVFPTSYTSLVEAGEASGKLDQVLRRLADNLEKERAFKSKVRSAMLYPAIVLTAMAVVFLLIIVFLIPKMTSLYESFEVDLPLTTRILIGISDFIIGFWYIVLGLMVAAFFAFRMFKNTPQGNFILSGLYLQIPIFGNLIKNSVIVDFSRSLGLLSEAGVPLVEALEIVKTGISNAIYEISMETIVDDVRHGLPLSQTISKDGNFPLMVPQMLLVGEETGSIGQRLNGLAEYYENEVDKVVKNLSTAMEPIIMVVLGLLVGLLVISVIMPIYQLTSQFG